MRPTRRFVRRAAAAALVGSAAGAFAVGAAAGPPWGPETPNFNLEVILRPSAGGAGFGHVRFRQPNDAEQVVYLDTWVRELEPNHAYALQRAVDTNLDGVCASSGWLTLGQWTTDDRGAGSAALSRSLPAPPGTAFDIHFRVVDAGSPAPTVLGSGCYRFTVSL